MIQYSEEKRDSLLDDMMETMKKFKPETQWTLISPAGEVWRGSPRDMLMVLAARSSLNDLLSHKPYSGEYEDEKCR